MYLFIVKLKLYARQSIEERKAIKKSIKFLINTDNVNKKLPK